MVREKASWYESDPGEIELALADLGGGNYFKPKDGKNVVRILPPYSDNGRWFHEGKFHYGFKLDGKNITVPYEGENSFIMKKLNELTSEGKEGAALARRHGPRTKFFVNIIDRESGNVKIWGFSKKIMQTLKAFYLDEEDGALFDDPKNGRDLIIERTGKGMETRYDVRFRPRPTPALEAGQEIPELFDLEAEAVKEFTKEELKAAWEETFEGADASAKNTSDENEDPDAVPVEKYEDDDDGKPAKKKKTEDDDDEDDAPAKKRKAAEQDDDDDEDDEKPAKRKKAVEEEAPRRRSSREERPARSTRRR